MARKNPKPPGATHPFTIGQQIGHWTVIALSDGKPEHKNKIKCRCVCGTIRWVFHQILTNGTSRSCGCRRHERANAQQIAGKEKGKRILDSIHQAHLTPKYAGFGRKVNRNSKTGIPGVSRIRSSLTSSQPRYRAQISVNGKQLHLGCFDNLGDAKRARQEAEQRYFKEKAQKAARIKKKIEEENA